MVTTLRRIERSVIRRRVGAVSGETDMKDIED